MTWWEALILGVAQGASEFLPISSSGHLLLLEKLGVGSQSLTFNIAVHVGTLVAVLIATRKRVWELMKRPFCKLTGNILLATIPTVILAAVFKFAFPSLLEGRLLGFGFVLTACLLYAGERLKMTKSTLLTPKISVLTGVLQGIAVLPGVSRSGATMSAMTLCGVDRSEAADFSFLLSVPVIVGSALLEGVQIAQGGAAMDVGWLPMLVGVAAAFFTGLAAITLFLKLVKKHSLLPFAAYTLLLGIVVTVLPLFGVKI